MEITGNNQFPPNQIRQIRSLRGFSRKAMARLLGQRGTFRLCLWETGKRLPSLQNALKLQIALQTSLSKLFPKLYFELESEIANQNSVEQT